MESQEKVFITCAWFKAFDRQMSEFWIDKQKPMRHIITRRIRTICSTVVIKEIKTFDATQV